MKKVKHMNDEKKSEDGPKKCTHGKKKCTHPRSIFYFILIFFSSCKEKNNMAAPGGAAAHVGAHAAAVAGDAYIIGPVGSASRHLNAPLVRAMARSHGNVRYAALADAEVVPRPQRVQEVIRSRAFRARWGRAEDAAGPPTNARDMIDVLRSFGHAGTKKHASLIVFAPSGGFKAAGAGDGMPPDEAAAYMDDGLFAEAIDTAVRGHFQGGLPARFRLRVDVMFTTQAGGLGAPGAGAPIALLGPDVLPVPRMYRGPQAVCTPAELSGQCEEIVDAFRHFVDHDMPAQGSNRTFGNLIAAYVWAFRTLDAGAGGNLYGGRCSGMKPWSPLSGPGLDGLPEGLFSCHGLVLNWQEQHDELCIARAITTGLDALLESTSDVNLLTWTLSTLEAAHKERRRTERDLGKPGSPAIQANRVSAHRLAASHVVALEKQVDAAKALFLKDGRHIRPNNTAASSSLYAARSRYLTIERNLRSAYAGTHPFLDFRHPFFSRAQPLSEHILDSLRLCLKPGFESKIRFQVWGIGIEDRIGIVAGDPKATMEFLREGGRVVNLLFAKQHVSWIRSVSACCNHRSADGKGEGFNRVHCGLCGHHVGRGNTDFKLRFFQHAVRGCARLTGQILPAPLSYANRRQLGKHNTAAKNRPLVMGALASAWSMVEPDTEDADADGCVGASLAFYARLPSGWAPLLLPTSTSHTVDVQIAQRQNAHEWEVLRKRWSHCHSANMEMIEAPVFAPPSCVERRIEPAVRHLLHQLASVENVNALLAQMHYTGPRDARALEQLQKIPLEPEEHMCFACGLRVGGPSRWKLQEAAASLDVEEDDADPDSVHSDADTDTDDEENAQFVEAVPQFVVHHCHATGFVAYAHGDCNDYMHQSTNALYIEVDDPRTMAEAVDVLFGRAYIECFLRGVPPSISEHEGVVTRVTFKLRGTDRALHSQEIARLQAKHEATGIGVFDAKAAAAIRKPRILTVTLRPRAALLARPPASMAGPFTGPLVRAFDSDRDTLDGHRAQVAAAGLMEEVVTWCEREFAFTSLWPSFFSTAISYSRGVLLNYAVESLPPGFTPTSIASKETLQSVRRMVTGGRIVLGEHVEMPTLIPDVLSHEGVQRARLLLDFTAAYPVQLKRWALPLLEHADAQIHDFSMHLQDGIHFLQSIKLGGPEDLQGVMRVELSGEFPAEMHAKLHAFPPCWSRREIFARDLSAFQRACGGLASDKSMGMRSVGHFFPLEKEVMFVREAQILLRLGFVCSHVGPVHCTPASFWGRLFATEMEHRRRSAMAAGDSETAEDVKLLINSVLGSLSVDVSKFCSLVPDKLYVAASSSKSDSASDDLPLRNTRAMTRAQRFYDNPRFTLRVLEAGDVLLYELQKASWRHEQQTLAFTFIQAMARCDLLELWYGGPCYEESGFGSWQPGIHEVFPEAMLGYGCTDSLVVEIQGSASAREMRGFKDVREEFWDAFKSRMDLSNVPSTSSFFTQMPPVRLREAKARIAEQAGKWGFLKEETGFAGVEAVVVNGPNRWAYRVVQSPSDTPPKFLGALQRDILKSIPVAWHNLFSLEAFAASWHAAELPLPAPLPLTLKTGAEAQLGTEGVHLKAPQRKHLSLWGNSSCIVSRTLPYRHYALGSKEPEAEALRVGDQW